jgi:hypothetical protein
LRKLAIIGISLFVLLLTQPMVGAQAEEAAIYTITMNYNVQNTGANQAFNVRMIIYLFDNVSGWAEQRVLSERIDGAILLSAIESTEDNRWVRISLGDLQPGESKTATVTQTLKINAVDLLIDPDAVGDTFPQELLDNFTPPISGLFESDHPALKALAHRLTENTANPYHKARQIFEFVVDNLEYKRQPKEHGALWGYQRGEGDCTEFSNLFIALLRAVNIPAKAVSGFGYRPSYAEGAVDLKELGHAFVMFYLPYPPNVIRVPADLVWPLNIGSFGELSYNHIVGATTGGECIVKDGVIRWPGPGAFKEPRYTVHAGRETTVKFSWASGTIAPEILIDPKLRASPQIEDGTLTLTLTTTNLGRQSVSNASASISADPTYFEIITPAQEIGVLTSGDQHVLKFYVRVMDAAYGKSHTLTANVIYHSTYGGVSYTFLAKDEAPVSISPLPIAPAQQLFDILLLALVGVLIGSAAAIAAALLQRR